MEKKIIGGEGCLGGTQSNGTCSSETLVEDGFIEKKNCVEIFLIRIFWVPIISSS